MGRTEIVIIGTIWGRSQGFFRSERKVVEVSWYGRHSRLQESLKSCSRRIGWTQETIKKCSANVYCRFFGSTAVKASSSSRIMRQFMSAKPLWDGYARKELLFWTGHHILRIWILSKTFGEFSLVVFTQKIVNFRTLLSSAQRLNEPGRKSTRTPSTTLSRACKIAYSKSLIEMVGQPIINYDFCFMFLLSLCLFRCIKHINWQCL